jgi:hypothetical protein
MPYYHIRVMQMAESNWSGVKMKYGVYSYELNLDEKEISEKSIEYLEGKDLFIDGKVLYNKRISEIKIFMTTNTANFESDTIKKNYEDGYSWNHDVTRRFINKPPQYNDEEKIELTKEGVFFAGQQYDAFKLIRDLISTAKTRIIVVDNYVDDSLLDMFTGKQPNVEIDLLTSPSSEQIIKGPGKKFNLQYKNLHIKTSTDYHDRFIIIDDKEFYHFGHSIKDLGKKTFMFSKIEEPKITTGFWQDFQTEWKTAKEIQL